MRLKERARKNFSEKKYNCCQAVICAYCEQYGINDDDIFKMTEGFGGGMGGLQETCGAVTGMFMAVSLNNSKGDKTEPTATKMDVYADVRALAEKFKEQCGYLDCRDLKEMVDGKQRVSCLVCVEAAAEILERYFIES